MSAHSLDSIGVVSAARILGAIGLLWGLVVALSWILFGGPLGGGPGMPELVIVVLVGPVYGIVGGAVTAIVYNLAASLTGGLEFDVSPASSKR